MQKTGRPVSVPPTTGNHLQAAATRNRHDMNLTLDKVFIALVYSQFFAGFIKLQAICKLKNVALHVLFRRFQKTRINNVAETSVWNNVLDHSSDTGDTVGCLLEVHPAQCSTSRRIKFTEPPE
jgi:hypothetical protein